MQRNSHTHVEKYMYNFEDFVPEIIFQGTRTHILERECRFHISQKLGLKLELYTWE